MSILTDIIGLEKAIKDATTKIANLSKKRASDADIEKLQAKIASDQLKLKKLVKSAQEDRVPGVFPEEEEDIQNDLFSEETSDELPAAEDGLDAGLDEGMDEDLDAGLDEGMDEDLDAGLDEGMDEDLDGDGIDDSVGDLGEEISEAVADVIEQKADEGASIDDLLASLRGDDIVDYESDDDQEFEPGDEEDLDDLDEEEDLDDFGDEDEELDEEVMDEDFDNQGDEEFGDDELEDEEFGDDELEDEEFGDEEFEKEDGGAPEMSDGDMGGGDDITPIHMASMKCKSCKSSTFIKKSNKLVCQHCGKPFGIALIEGNFDVPINKDFEGEVEDTFDNVEELAGEMFGHDDMHGESSEDEFEEDDEFGDDEEFESDEFEEEEHESPEDEFGDHEEDESEEWEEEEHESPEEEDEEDEEEDEEEEDEEFDEEEEEDINKYSATLIKKKSKAESYWNVYCNSQPMFRIIAKSAWKNLESRPQPKEFPFKFASYWDVFISKLYHDSIVDHCSQYGIKQACSLANGRFYKSAQLSNYGGNPATGPMGENPMPNVGQAGGTAGEDPMAEAPGTLNPDAEAADQLGASEPNKVLVSDMIINWLAAEVANGTYTTDEILTELKATFNDEAAASEFEGELTRQADTFSDKAEEGPETEGEGDVDLSQFGDMGDMGAPGQSENTQQPASPPSQPMKMAKDLKIKLAQKDEIIEKQAEQIKEQNEELALRFKVASALQFVKNEMQTRGFSHTPLVATMESLSKEGSSEEDAIKLVEAAISTKVKDIVKMSDDDFTAYSELVYQTPKLASEQNDYAAEMEKSASLIPYIPSEQKVGMDAVLPEDGFRTGLSDAAEKHAAQRKNRLYL